ncbi:hypothetical protein B0T14DRAFT_605129 [Immersiella caudata]|uniref:Uncharacterized protein n=1 Tax=Immersiella caudata TaxID=314043 RepID=A0AA39WKC6_9PEZI|nr:hypothetical protein B0T14DRAFT_605129 [Immersiella caudata]
MSAPVDQVRAERRDKFLEAVQQTSTFGGSITFALIVGSNSPPTRRFSDQTVRDILSVAWLLFFVALGGSTLARLRGTVDDKEQSMLSMRKDFRPLAMGVLALLAFCVLSVVVLAYSDVGWAAVAVMALGVLYVAFKGFRRRWRRARGRKQQGQQQRQP